MQAGKTTVIVPTTGDRAQLLERSVGSALAQSETNLEVFIVGDGLDAASVAACEAFSSLDSRIRFFDHPKDQRRGERHRHHLLTHEADGDVVAYLTDRDLWLPNHVAELRRVLADVDFAHTLRFGIGPSDEIELKWRSDLAEPAVRARHNELPVLVPLSFVGHTMAAYRRLPFGWRTTPDGFATDRYMWSQFLDQDWCRVGASSRATVLYFKRGGHPGLSTVERLRLLDKWAERSLEPGFVDDLNHRITEALLADRSAMVERIAARPLNRLRRKKHAGAPSALARFVPTRFASPLRRRFKPGPRIG